MKRRKGKFEPRQELSLEELMPKAYRELQAAQAALVEKERLERELELAREVQRSLLPGAAPDIEGIAAPVSHWVKTSLSSKDVARDGAEAIQAAQVGGRFGNGHASRFVGPHSSATARRASVSSPDCR